MADAQVQAMIDEGAVAIESLTVHSARLSDAIAKTFPQQSLQQVADAMAAQVKKEALNEKVAKLGALVREEAAAAQQTLRQAEMWIRLKIPSVSDGNNFGVDVQNFVISEIVAMRTAMDAMLTAGRDYHWSRAQ